MDALVAGLDLGSTAFKVLVADSSGHTLVLRSRPTPWQERHDGSTVMTVDGIRTAVGALLREIADALTGLSETRPIQVLAVTGMGESGFLLDRDLQAVAPAFAWFDLSGHSAVAALPERLRAEFAGRTGLPWGVQVSAAKIAHLRDSGIDLRGRTWYSLPEFVVLSLGGRPGAEWSLASRTGLLDQDTGRPWVELLEHLGWDSDCLPPLVEAGSPWGTTDPTRVPAAFAAAQLTVAGHDHLVSARSVNAGSSGGYHISMGTAEVLLRIVDEPLPFEARSRLGEQLINCVPHVVPGQYAVVAGVKTGLLLRRALAMVGARDADARRRLDGEVLRLLQPGRPGSGTPEGVTVSGARNDDGMLSLRLTSDDISPAGLILAIFEHSNQEISRLIEAMDRELPPTTRAQLSGGWTSWASLGEVRRRILPDLQVSAHPQDTAYGAVLSALSLLEPGATTVA